MWKNLVLLIVERESWNFLFSTMKTYGGIEVLYLYALSSAQEGGEWSASQSG
jgi:hypothetical protein